MSLESLRFMLGGAIHRPETNKPVLVRRTAETVLGADGKIARDIEDTVTKSTVTPKAITGYPIRLINLTTGVRTQIEATGENATEILSVGSKILFKNTAAKVTTATAGSEGDRVRIFWTEQVTGAEDEKLGAIEVTISPDTYPGTYRVVGDTFIRNQRTGADEPFQFVIDKAKVLSDVTLSLEAEGDPSTNQLLVA